MQSRYYHTILYPTQARYSHTVLYFFPRPPDLANAIRFYTFSPIRYGERNGSFRAFFHAVMEATITHLRDVWNAVDSRGKTSPTDASFYRPYFSFIPLAQGHKKWWRFKRPSPLTSSHPSRSEFSRRKFYKGRNVDSPPCGELVRLAFCQQARWSRIPWCSRRGSTSREHICQYLFYI